MAVEILGISLLNIQYYMAKLNKKNNKNILFITTFLLLLDYFFKAKRTFLRPKEIASQIKKRHYQLYFEIWNDPGFNLRHKN